MRERWNSRQLSRGAFVVAILAACSLLFTHAASFNLSANDVVEPVRINIAEWNETFVDEFKAPLDVTTWGPSRWIAHTPWRGDFGDARFVNPGPGFPFKTGPEGLTIEARKKSDGKWDSGLLSSRDGQGNGFQQAQGYFEIRAQLPPGSGVWPAFWLVSDADPDRKAEIDVLEYHGDVPTRYTATIHIWPKGALKTVGLHESRRVQVPEGALTKDFHTYGVSIDENWIVAYLDRLEVARWQSRSEFQKPMFVLLDLALGSGWPIDKTPNPSVMRVDYVRAFAHRPAVAP